MICGLIPTYNNATTIADIVKRTLRQVPLVVVVNDGSTDETASILSALEQTEKALSVVTLPKNKGKGYALKCGFQKARELGCTHAITLDADGQHFPEDIPELIHISKIRPEAIIVGSRGTKHDNMPSSSTFANRFSNFWFAVQTGLYLPDTQTGFRVYPLDAIHGERLMTRRYEAELLVLVLSAWANVPIIPSPVRVYYPPKEERVSSFRPFRDFSRISILNTILCVLALIYGLPRRYGRFVYYGICFFIFAAAGKIITSLYRLRPTPENEQKMHYRIQRGCQIFLSAFPTATYTVNFDDSKNTPAIYIANHSSYLDIIALLALSDKMRLIGKAHIVNNKFYGCTAQTIGFIPITTGAEDMTSIVKHWTDQGYSVGIFPEGTRSLYGVPLRFHSGAFHLAEQLHLPIQPILLEGYAEALQKRPFHVGKPKQICTTLLPRIEPDDNRFGGNRLEKAKQMRAYYDQLLMHEL
ncbi:MAG: glycosyltransferase [Paludibacteraceae bacterium]|nr:glycosyltransferase [Paludibacteraceae bacterium]